MEDPECQSGSGNILKDVVAYVEVRSSNDNRSAAVCRQLELLGASVTANFTDDVTHVVFKEGLKRTYLKAQKKGIPLVSVSWLESCKRNQMRVPEKEFAALVAEEPDNPLIKMKQNRRWKKMKSMQPCDFDEEVARSAERGTKKRRRIELANRFKLSDDSTPPGGSPAMVLALDTQARSPFCTSSSRLSSPCVSVVPDTPHTPTMKERIEKMRREQRILIGAGDESPRTSVSENGFLQKKLFEKLAQDIFSTEDSGDEDDQGETTARVVAKLIEGLDAQSCSPRVSPRRKKSVEEDSKKPSLQDCSQQERIKDGAGSLAGLCTSPGHNGCQQGASVLDSPKSNAKERKFSSYKENKRQKDSSLRESRHSTDSSSEESGVLSPVSINKSLPQEASHAAFQTNAANSNESKSPTAPQHPSEDTPKTTRANRKLESVPGESKVVKKKKLFTDPVFSMAVLPVQEDAGARGKLPQLSADGIKSTVEENKESLKGKGKKSAEAEEVSFLFSSDKGKVKPPNPDRRRSQRLSMIKQSVSPSSTKSDKSSVSSRNNGKEFADSKTLPDNDKCAVNFNSRHSLGTSMSVLYGGDMTMSNCSLHQPRKSIDEFSFKPMTIKPKKLGEIKGFSSGTDVKKKNLSTKEQNLKRKASNQFVNSDTASPAKRKKDVVSCDQSQSHNSSEKSKDESYDTPEEDISAPCQLRHARSLVMESQAYKTGGKERKFALVATSLHRDEQDVLYSVIKKLGVFHVKNQVECSTTHLVCGESRRTLNLLHAIARGCWILTKEWVLKSLEAGEWLMEEEYEMVSEFPAAKVSRMKRQSLGGMYKADLFSHVGSIFVSKECVPPRQDLIQLITLCSGKVTNSKHRASINVGLEYTPDKTVVKPAWVLDSIMKMSTQESADYSIRAQPFERENSPEF